MTLEKRTRNRTTNRVVLIVGFLLPLVALGVFFGLAQAAATAVPIVDLNGDLQGREYAATFTEDDGPEPIVNATGLTITDPDSSNLSWARVTLTENPDGALEVLAADPGATGISVNYKPADGVLNLTGVSSIADYQQVLRTLTYLNSSQGPDVSDRIVLVEVHDGTGRSEPITSTVAINPVNDAPLLDNTGNMALASINENDFASPGNRVETILSSAGGDRITDPDRDALEGIAVIEVGSSNGAWQYSLNAGASWLPFENVSNQSAVLLNPAARIRFVPKPQFNGSASITFRAWDQTQGMNGDTGVDVTKNGGTTAFSTATETASITVNPVDDAPVVDLNGPDPGQDFSAGYLGSSVPVPVADQDATITDPDSQTLTKATFHLTTRPDGTSESLAADVGGKSITLLPYDPATGLLVLNGPDTVDAFEEVLRSVVYINSAANPAAGARIIHVTVNDGVSDSTQVTATIQINPDNNAPVLNAPSGFVLSPIVEDATDPPGDTVAAMLADAGGDPITDPDPSALEGIAIIGADDTRGAWQFATVGAPDTPLSWQPVGPVSNTAAVLLNPESRLRFVPATDYAGPSGSLTFRAWDQTTGTNGQRNVNTSVNGGSTAFSEQSAVASLTVTPVNDAPVITYTATNPLVYQEDSPPLPLLSGGLVITDVDNANLSSATVSLINRPNGDAETLAVTVGASGLVAEYAGGVLQLTGSATLETYRQVLATLTYVNASQDPDVADRQVQVVVSDGTTASAPLSLTIGILALNDPPLVDLNGAGPGADYNTSFFIQWGPIRVADPNMLVVDLDDTSLVQVTVRIANLLDAQAETLTATTAATNIKQSYDPATGTLLLSGIDSVANYQQVVRSVRYNNALENPSTTARSIEFRASDAAGPGPVSKSVVNILPTPTAYLFMPMVGRRSEEPNDTCSAAPMIPLNRDELYYADDKNDWFYFDLPAAADVVVSVEDFADGEGQLVVAGGAGCNSLKLLGSNGDDRPDKSVDLGRLTAGRYYIWIINDGAPNTQTPYLLRVDTTP